MFQEDSVPAHYFLHNETDDGIEASSRFTMVSFYFFPRNASGTLVYIGNHRVRATNRHDDRPLVIMSVFRMHQYRVCTSLLWRW